MTTELFNLLNRAAAAIETPADLTDDDRTALIEDLAVAAQPFEENLEIEIDDTSHIGETEEWETIADDRILHVWAPDGSPDGEDEITVAPSWYAENGTPTDPETGDDMSYVRTEVRNV